MKREREGGEFEVLDMVDCLMLLSKMEEPRRKNGFSPTPAADSDKIFVCKTCNRKFSSFQALGGHRTSHTKPSFNANGPPTKSKAHECPICGLDFPIGQALGGHMRRHRNTAAAAVLKKSDGCGKRVFELDLNLPPLENNLNLKLQLSL